MIHVDFHQQLLDEKEIVYIFQCTGRELTQETLSVKETVQEEILEVVKALSVDPGFYDVCTESESSTHTHLCVCFA